MDNQKGPKFDLQTQWKRFDSLPPRVREVYARAPFNYAIYQSDVRAAKEAPERMRKALIERFVQDLRFETIKTYGLDHPQAGGVALRK